MKEEFKKGNVLKVVLKDENANNIFGEFFEVILGKDENNPMRAMLHLKKCSDNSGKYDNSYIWLDKIKSINLIK